MTDGTDTPPPAPEPRVYVHIEREKGDRYSILSTDLETIGLTIAREGALLGIQFDHCAGNGHVSDFGIDQPVSVHQLAKFDQIAGSFGRGGFREQDL